MINSLSKDSHITLRPCYSQKIHSESSLRKGASPITGKRVGKEYYSATVNKQGISVTKPAEINFSGLSNAKTFGEKLVRKFNSSTKVKKLLEIAANNQVVFSAGFALLLTGLLRPATIVALPGNKKNVNDQKYAAAHSIASGVIGFGLSFILASPIAKGIEKVLAKPDKYLTKNAQYLKDTGAKKAAKNYVNQLPDIAIAAPKAIVTIALIPIILKYVFGLEKKKGKHQETTEQDYLALNFRSASSKEKEVFQSFTGGRK